MFNYSDRGGYRRRRKEHNPSIIHEDDSVLIPKTESYTAQQAYMQLLELCSGFNVDPEVIARTLDSLEKKALAYKRSKILNSRIGLELENVSRYYRWVYKNITHIQACQRV